MNKFRIGLNIVFLGVLFLALYLITLFAKPIRGFVNMPRALVAGVSDSIVKDTAQDAFPQNLAEDTKQQLEAVKEDALHIRVGQIIEFVGRSQKIVNDLQRTKERVESFINKKK